MLVRHHSWDLGLERYLLTAMSWTAATKGHLPSVSWIHAPNCAAASILVWIKSGLFDETGEATKTSGLGVMIWPLRVKKVKSQCDYRTVPVKEKGVEEGFTRLWRVSPRFARREPAF